jgi:hypothetical protein
MSGHELSPALEARLELVKEGIIGFTASRYTTGTSSSPFRFTRHSNYLIPPAAGYGAPRCPLNYKDKQTYIYANQSSFSMTGP